MTVGAANRSGTVRRSAVLAVPPSNVDAVHQLLETVWAEAPYVAMMERFRFATAMIELSGNVMEYATAQGVIDFRVDVTVTVDHLEGVVTDTGVGIGSTLDIHKLRDMPDELSESGRGIAMIQSLVDDFTYERVDGVNRWRIGRTVVG